MVCCALACVLIHKFSLLLSFFLSLSPVSYKNKKKPKNQETQNCPLYSKHVLFPHMKEIAHYFLSVYG